MYNSNNSGYTGYPPQQQYGGTGDNGYPHTQSGYGRDPCFDDNAPYRDCYPRHNAPIYPDRGRESYPCNFGSMPPERPSPYESRDYPHQATNNVMHNYGGGGHPDRQPYGQQDSLFNAPRPHTSPFDRPQSAPFNMYDWRPTIKMNQYFQADTSAEMLHKALKGYDCNRDKVIQSLCSINNWQRQEVALAYKALYGEDLINELKSELNGDFEDLILALMQTPAHYDAHQLHHAMAGFGTTESVLIEIMVTRDNMEINAIKEAYQHLYQCSLEDDIISDTSGALKHLLVSLCAAWRDETFQIDPIKANQDAHLLYRDTIEGNTDEDTLKMILVTQNYAQLRLFFEEYDKISGGHPIERVIETKFSGDILDGLMSITKFVRNRAAYFAELLNKSMKGYGTNDADLIRIVVSRSEIDLGDIQEAYQYLYEQSLEEAIDSECSGAYKEGLIALIKGN